MKRILSAIVMLTAGVLVLSFSGCTKEKEVDLTDWSTPGLDKLVGETEEVTAPEKETEQEIKEPRPVTYYVVKKGDSINSIATRYGMSPRQLAEANNLKLKGAKSIIHPRQRLIIPDPN